jgi:RNA polymerase sigma factor (sigma-70 family)
MMNGVDAELTDAELVARCRNGNDECWRQLVERYSRYVYAISVQAFRLPESDADDVFQEVFARAYEHLDTLRDDAALRPWLAQLTRRLCIDTLRSGSREQPAGEDIEPEGVDDTIEQIDEALAVHEAMRTLPDHCAEILDRFFARDESYRTIGEALELPSGTVASRISRCLTRLRGELEGEGRNAAPAQSGGWR